jgi:hypothetical protein
MFDLSGMNFKESRLSNGVIIETQACARERQLIFTAGQWYLQRPNVVAEPAKPRGP